MEAVLILAGDSAEGLAAVDLVRNKEPRRVFLKSWNLRLEDFEMEALEAGEILEISTQDYSFWALRIVQIEI